MTLQEIAERAMEQAIRMAEEHGRPNRIGLTELTRLTHRGVTARQIGRALRTYPDVVSKANASYDAPWICLATEEAPTLTAAIPQEDLEILALYEGSGLATVVILSDWSRENPKRMSRWSGHNIEEARRDLGQLGNAWTNAKIYERVSTGTWTATR